MFHESYFAEIILPICSNKDDLYNTGINQKSKWKLYRRIFIMLATMLLIKRWFSTVTAVLLILYERRVLTYARVHKLSNVRKVTQRKRFVWRFVSHFIFRITIADIIKRVSIKELCKHHLVFVNCKHRIIWYLIPRMSLRRQLFHFCSPLCFTNSFWCTVLVILFL